MNISYLENFDRDQIVFINHRITQWFGMKEAFKIIQFQQPCYGKGHALLDQVAQILIQPSLEHIQGLSIMTFSVLKKAVQESLMDCAEQTVTWNECDGIIHTDNWQILNAQESLCWSYFWKKLASGLWATYLLCQTKPAIFAIVPQPLAPAAAVVSKWSGAHSCLVAAQGSCPAEVQPS